MDWYGWAEALDFCRKRFYILYMRIRKQYALQTRFFRIRSEKITEYIIMTVTFGKIYLRICVNAPVIVVNCTIWGWEKSKSYKNESMDFAPQLINCGTEGIFKFPEREKEALLQFAPQSASPSQSYQGMARTGLENRKSPEGTETVVLLFQQVYFKIRK